LRNLENLFHFEHMKTKCNHMENRQVNEPSVIVLSGLQDFAISEKLNTFHTFTIEIIALAFCPFEYSVLTDAVVHSL
jgi:hypothetical protein